MSTDSELEDCGNLPYELHRKMVAKAFWNVEIESELREANMISHKFTSTSSKEDLMCTVDEQRALYIPTWRLLRRMQKERYCYIISA